MDHYDKTGKLREMTELDRIAEYNRTIHHKPVATDYAIQKACKEYFGIEVEISDHEQIEQLRKWIYYSKNPESDAAHREIDTGKITAPNKPKLSKV